MASMQVSLVDDFDGSVFADWNEVEDWAKPFIGAAVKAGYVFGSLDTGSLFVYASNDITRQEMVAMAVRVLAIDVGDEITHEKILDYDETDEWAKPTLSFAVFNDMINVDNALVRPLSKATRAETAMTLYKMLMYLYHMTGDGAAAGDF